jgi:hypothetical protein
MITIEDKNLITANKNIEEFVRKYCAKHKISPLEAMQHRLVSEVIDMYLGK